MPTLLTKLTCPLGLTAAAQVLEQETESVDAFLDRLASRERIHPVVLVSVDHWTERPVADVSRLANRLAGVAIVYVMADKHVGFKLDRRLPAGEVPTNGAVRLYWPDWRPTEPGGRHPMFTVDRIKRLRQKRWDGFAAFLLDLLARGTSHSSMVDYPTIEQVSAEALEERIAKARADKDLDGLVRLYADENADLKKRNEGLQFQLLEREDDVTSLSEQVERAEQERDVWRKAFQDAKAGRDVEDESLPDVPPESAREAFDRAERVFGDRLVIKPNSRSDIGYAYEAPEEVYSALEWLAGPYYEWRTGKRPGVTHRDMDVELRRRCEWFYKTSQSGVTASKYADWYKTTVDGETFDVLEHVGRGNTKRQGTKSIRVAFCWDEPRERVVIGFVGQHQKTDQS